jgi:hypothetical protein
MSGPPRATTPPTSTGPSWTTSSHRCMGRPARCQPSGSSARRSLAPQARVVALRSRARREWACAVRVRRARGACVWLSVPARPYNFRYAQYWLNGANKPNVHGVTFAAIPMKKVRIGRVGPRPANCMRTLTPPPTSWCQCTHEDEHEHEDEHMSTTGHGRARRWMAFIRTPPTLCARVHVHACCFADTPASVCVGRVRSSCGGCPLARVSKR